MKGIVCEKAGAPLKITDDLPMPEPSADQILVKPIYVAINPVDEIMRSTGAIVQKWPWVPGCDASGIVVKVGENAAASFKVGDKVCGCARLGWPGHGVFAEYYLMDAAVTIPKPEKLSLLEAVTIGVGIETAALAVFDALGVDFKDLQNALESKSTGQSDSHQWAVVIGGSSSVGKFGVQLLNRCGFKVIASCSTNSVPVVKKQGAEAAFDYKKSVEEQVKDVLSVTGGKVHHVFDATGTGEAFARALFHQLSEGPKHFATTNAWGGITDFEGGRTRSVVLAPVGSPSGEHINKLLNAWIPTLVALFDKGLLIPNPYDLIGQGGFESVLEAYEYQKKGAGGSSKVVAKVQDE